MAKDTNQQRHFTQSGFVAATMVIALIVVFGIVIVIVNMNREDPDPALTTSTSADPTTIVSASDGSEAEAGGSVCGLAGEVLEGTLAAAPAAEWEFQDTTAYPTSAEFGPGDTNADGVRYCFQHSPEGAVFAAANAVVQGSDATTSPAWIEYFLSADTPNRSYLLDQVAAGSSPSNRMAVVGFRLLAYDGVSARVDVAVQATGSGNTVFASVVYDLVWEAGDWKLLPKDFSNPLRLAEIPNTVGYITWER